MLFVLTKQLSRRGETNAPFLSPIPPRGPLLSLAMIRTIAISVNWAMLALFFVAMLATSQTNAIGAAIIPLLPFGTALANYHFRPKLPMVWLSLALNVLFCVIGVFAIVAAALGKSDKPVPLVVLVILLFTLPCVFNVRNMLRIRLKLKQHHG